MLKNRLTKSVLTLLAISAALSCAPGDRRESPLAPDNGAATPTAPSDLLGLLPPPPPTSSEYTLIEERAPRLLETLEVSGVIGIFGGKLSLAGHALTVPYGAVTLPTVFTLRLLPTGYIEVELEAVLTSLLGRTINVGEEGFRKPVPVTLTYVRATNVTDPSRLRIMRVKADGNHEILPSTVDTQDKTVTAELDHFSRYCMVAN